MIFVTVGTHDMNFDRLVRAADELAGLVSEQVVIQRGCGAYTPRIAMFFEWATSQEMEEWVSQSRVVVAQAGAGTIIMTLKQGKPLVITPRLRQYHENYNDHQIQLAYAMDAQRRAICVSDLSGKSLQEAINKASQLEPSITNSTNLKEAIRQRLDVWQKSSRRS